MTGERPFLPTIVCDHPQLRSYLRGGRLPADEAVEFGNSLYGLGHPQAVYAAGWVAAELAMEPICPDRGREGRVTKVPYETRMSALDTANERWQAAREMVQQFRGPDSSRGALSRAYMLEAQVLESLAYVPVMTVCSTLLAGQTLPDGKTKGLLKRTRKLSREMVAFVLEPGNVQDINTMEKRWLRAGIACGLLGQAVGLDQFAVVPASVRKRNRAQFPRRSDYFAVRMTHPFPRLRLEMFGMRPTPQQVNYGLHFSEEREMVVEGGETVRDTLLAFQSWKTGNDSGASDHVFEGAAIRVAQKIMEEFEQGFKLYLDSSENH